MDIEKIPGANRFTPTPKPDASSKPSEVQFDATLKSMIESIKASEKPSPTADEMDPEKLKLIRDRISSGFYNRPEVIERTAERILSKGRENG